MPGEGARSISSEPAWRRGEALPELAVDVVDEAALAPIFKAFWLL